MIGRARRSVNQVGALWSTIAHPASIAVSRHGRWARAWDRALSATVFPPTCSLCGARDVRGLADLCELCAASFPRLGSACPRCALPSALEPAPGSDHPPCPACRRRPPPFDRAIVPLRYEYPVDRLVRGLKFHGERVFARLLAAELAAARCVLGPPWPELLVPLPLHRQRLRERGFNQAQELARYAGRWLGLPLAGHVLERVLPTLEQSGLSAAERRRNVRHAFRLRRAPPARHVALVDDVLTTGSTAAEAARVLKSGGVAIVELWTVARALPSH